MGSGDQSRLESLHSACNLAREAGIDAVLVFSKPGYRPRAGPFRARRDGMLAFVSAVIAGDVTDTAQTARSGHEPTVRDTSESLRVKRERPSAIGARFAPRVDQVLRLV